MSDKDTVVGLDEVVMAGWNGMKPGSVSGTWILNRIFLFILFILTLFLHQLPSILLTHHFTCDLFFFFYDHSDEQNKKIIAFEQAWNTSTS